MIQETDTEIKTEVEIGVETEVEIEAEIEGDSRNNSRDRGRSNSRENRNNQQRSGSGQRYFDKKDFCEYCNRTGHPAHRCFKLENYLKRQGKRIVLHDDDDVQDIAQAVQDLNTKLNSLKLNSSTNN